MVGFELMARALYQLLALQGVRRHSDQYALILYVGNIKLETACSKLQSMRSTCRYEINYLKKMKTNFDWNAKQETSSKRSNLT